MAAKGAIYKEELARAIAKHYKRYTNRTPKNAWHGYRRHLHTVNDGRNYIWAWLTDKIELSHPDGGTYGVYSWEEVEFDCEGRTVRADSFRYGIHNAIEFNSCNANLHLYNNRVMLYPVYVEESSSSHSCSLSEEVDESSSTSSSSGGIRVYNLMIFDKGLTRERADLKVII